MGILDIDCLAERMRANRESFASATPFPHVVIDHLLPDDLADALAAEFADPAIGWRFLHHVNERKRVFGDRERMGPVGAALVAELHSAPFRQALEGLTGVTGLIGDPELDGAGLHEMLPGGHLNVHADALAHAKNRTWSRQLNLILFLNRDWEESWRGWLELWDAKVERCVRQIAPVFNRCVVFRVADISFHGVPEGVFCPPERTRRSLALYYFRNEGHGVPLAPTRYVPRPTDPRFRRALIHLDRALLAAYSLLKRYTPLDNTTASRILRRL